MEPEKIPNITGYIEAEVPNHRLYNFVGTLNVEGESHSLNYQNLLLRVRFLSSPSLFSSFVSLVLT